MMLKSIVVALFLTFSVSYPLLSQDLYAIAAISDFNNSAEWSLTPGGPSCSCTPTAANDVYTMGNTVNANGGSPTVRNLFVQFDDVGAVTIPAFATLNITGTLSGWDGDATGSPTPPSVAVITYGSGSGLNFTGSNLSATPFDPYIIFAWTDAIPIGRTNVSLSSLSKNLLVPLSFSGTLTVASGTLTADAGVNLSGTGFTVSNGATFVTSDPLAFTSAVTVNGTIDIQGASGTLTASSLTINATGNLTTVAPLQVTNTVGITGILNATNTTSAASLTLNSGGSFSPSNSVTLTNTLTVNSGASLTASGSISSVNTTISGSLTTSNYLNTSGALTLNASSSFSTSYLGTQGWWLTTNAPGSSSFNASSTLSFTRAGAQQVPADGFTYGNLTIGGSGTKTMTGSTLAVTGNLTISTSFDVTSASSIDIGGNLTNAVAWSTPSSCVLAFNGAGAQSISGAGTITLSGGLEVAKSAGTLTHSKSATSTIANGITITSGTYNVSDRTITLSSGNIANNGTLTTTGSTFNINGSTSIVGSSTTTLNNVIVGAAGTLTAANNMVVGGNLTNGGTVVCASGGNLQLNGNFANTGTFTANNGTLIFDGSALQTLSGTLSVNNLTVNNAVDNNATLSLNGILSLDGSSDFNANGTGTGTLTIRSTSLTAGGRIGALSAPEDFTGTVTVERFVNSPENYRYLSFPVENPNLGMWKSDNAVNGIPITGNFSNPTPAGPASGAKAEVISASSASVFFFDAATQAYVAVANPGQTVSAANSQVTNTRGYVAWTYLNANTTLRMTGTIGKGAINIPMSAAGDGWNLVPNPYPSPIDIDNVTTTNTTNTIYFTTAQGAFATYLKGSGTCTGCSFNTNWRGEISTGQSFWVQSTGATSLALTETAKTTGSSTFVREETPSNFFRVTLAVGDKEDDLIIRFQEGASEGVEYDRDAIKKNNENGFINISSYNSDANTSYAINTIPLINCEETVKLKIQDVQPGEHTLRFSEIESMQLGYTLALVDHFLDSEIDLSEEDEYTFSVTADPLSFGSNRFEIKIMSPQVDLTRALSLSSTQECDSEMITIHLENLQPGVKYLFKLNDVSLHEPITGQTGAVVSHIQRSFLQPGVNSLDLVATSIDGCNAHIFNNALEVSLHEINEVTSVTDGQSCGAGSVILSATGALSNGSYLWYESENAIEPINGANTATFVTPELSATTVYYVSVVNPVGCESENRMAVEAAIISVAPPELSVDGYVIHASGSGDFQWYKDNEAIEGATSATYEVKETGSYSVTSTVSGCSTASENLEFLITDAETATGSSGYSIFPNPSDGIFQIRGNFTEHHELSVYDSQGRKLEGADIVTDVKSGHAVIDIVKNRKGVYLINIQDQNKIILLKAIKK